MQNLAVPVIPKKVLIVDDDPQVVKTLTYILEKLGGYKTSVAMDGKEALQGAARGNFDLIILDLKLPKLHGEEVCKKIRKDDKIKNTPIIMLTGKYSEADKIIGKVIGADYYLTKPFDILELLRIIADIFGIKNNSAT